MEIFLKGLFKARKLFILTAAFGLITACHPLEVEPENHEETDTVSAVYEVFNMNIKVENNASIVSKDTYLNCTISVDGKGILDDYQGTARIRGRGNSSWLWYDKKPYRIKLDEKSKILGLKSNRDWVLLANYRDPTDLMYTFSFEAASLLELSYVNHTRYVEVTLNGDYIGLYQMTEQIEQGGNRVDIDEVNGILLSLDADDGPYYSPDASDNFWSTVFDLPVCVKYPEEPTTDQLSAIRDDFTKLEKAINSYNYDSVAALMNIPSFIDYMILQELIYNVEVEAPRSIFIYKDAGGKYVMGPAWDFDAGFDFDWNTMYTGHNYFNAQELVLGTDPVNHTNGYGVSNFFTQLFRNTQFVSEYKARWNEVKDYIFKDSWDVAMEYSLCMQDALARDYKRWPIDRKYSTETDRMENWLSQRVPYLTTVINNYPAGTVNTTKIDCGTISCDVAMSYQLGYSQTVTVYVAENNLLSLLGITHDELYGPSLKIVPLNNDGSEGMNNTNGIYGGWFESNNNPGYWSNGHVFIEIDANLTEWSCGLRADDGYCSVGEQHSVRMQYQYTQGTETKTVTVTVNFTIVA